MNERWMIQYDSMLKEMESCPGKFQDIRSAIECRFNLAQQHWTRIQQSLEDYTFTSKEEEIIFYKKVKPLFRSEIEYYNLVYHAELFKPVEKPGEMKEFWIKEQQRLDRFIKGNEVFYAYYKNGATNRDEGYFLSPGQSVYYDDLISMLLALERYSLYTSKELSGL